jgi:hypothetical protein
MRGNRHRGFRRAAGEIERGMVNPRRHLLKPNISRNIYRATPDILDAPSRSKRLCGLIFGTTLFDIVSLEF